MRVYGMDSQDYGLYLGLIVLFGGGLGSIIGGLLSDKLMHYSPAAKVYVIAVSQILAAPCIFAVLWVSSYTTSFGLLFLAYVTAETWLGPAAAVVQDLMPADMRARASSVYITANTLIGGLGPLFVGELLGSDGVLTRKYGEKEAVRYALIYIVPTCYVAAAGVFFLTGQAILHCRSWKGGVRGVQNMEEGGTDRDNGSIVCGEQHHVGANTENDDGERHLDTSSSTRLINSREDTERHQGWCCYTNTADTHHLLAESAA